MNLMQEIQAWLLLSGPFLSGRREESGERPVQISNARERMRHEASAMERNWRSLMGAASLSRLRCAIQPHGYSIH